MKVFERKLEKKIEKFIDRREIIGIRGPRQSGKTTLLKMIFNKINTNRAFINMDRPDLRKSFETNPITFVKRFKDKGKLFLFLDEVQRVKNAGEYLKIIYDEFQDVKIFFSGSSSLEMKTNILPFLVGRLFLFNLYTFDFEEFVGSKDKGMVKVFRELNKSVTDSINGHDEPSPPVFDNEFLELWKEYAVFGGYPEVVKARDVETKITILKNIHNLYIERDVVSFFGIEETSKFDEFVKYLAFNISSILSLSNISSDLKISYRKVEEFLSILQHTYIVSLLKPLHKNLVTEIRKAPKLYFLDLGLRNSVLDNFVVFDNRTDRGEIMENFIFRELLPFEGLNYWRTTGKAEVDFVIKENEYIIPVEVKMSGEKLTRGFHSFLRAYKPEKAFIVTLDTFKKQKIMETNIYWVPVWYF